MLPHPLRPQAIHIVVVLRQPGAHPSELQGWGAQGREGEGVRGGSNAGQAGGQVDRRGRQGRHGGAPLSTRLTIVLLPRVVILRGGGGGGTAAVGWEHGGARPAPPRCHSRCEVVGAG